VTGCKRGLRLFTETESFQLTLLESELQRSVLEAFGVCRNSLTWFRPSPQLQMDGSPGSNGTERKRQALAAFHRFLCKSRARDMVLKIHLGRPQICRFFKYRK